MSVRCQIKDMEFTIDDDAQWTLSTPLTEESEIYLEVLKSVHGQDWLDLELGYHMDKLLRQAEVAMADLRGGVVESDPLPEAPEDAIF